MERVNVREMDLRDDLKPVNVILPTAVKMPWTDQQAACGFRDIEITLLVPAELLQQFIRP